MYARLVPIEAATELNAVIRRVESLTGRLDAIDTDGGRLDSVELELEDIVGPDGDVVDLNERMDRLEGKAPDLIKNLRAREKRAPDPVDFGELKQQIDAIQSKLEALGDAVGEAQTVKPSEADAGALGAVKRSGDVMTGGLVINRGGLDVLSGGVTCRGAQVTPLEASNLIKAPKVLVDALELRGDLTVDSATRAMQVRFLEGRQASARRDGALHLNGRGGADCHRKRRSGQVRTCTAPCGQAVSLPTRSVASRSAFMQPGISRPAMWFASMTPASEWSGFESSPIPA